MIQGASIVFKIAVEKPRIFSSFIWLTLVIPLFTFGGGCVASKEYKVAQTIEQNPNIPHIILDGVTLHAETFGDPKNQPVIVLHGGPGWDYRNLLPIKALSNEYFVIFYDQRGTGLSPRVDGKQLTLESSIADLDSVINHYGKGRKVNLIGHSWGGMLASSYVGRYPEKVSHLVLAEPGPLTQEMYEIFHDKYTLGLPFVFHVIGAWLGTIGVSDPDDQAGDDQFMYEVLIAYKGDDRPMAGYFCNKKASPAALEHWRLGLEAYNNIRESGLKGEGYIVSLVKGVEDFKGEVLFLTSSCDTILGVDLQKKQMKYFPKARIVVVDDAGHYLFGEKPTESLAPVRDYFKTKE
jgi:proline iminopeptidase